MSETKLLRCKCESVYQDAKYGKGIRVANKTNKAGIYHCTVCASNLESKITEKKS